MNPVFPARKRAEQFSALVEDSPTTPPSDTGTYADLVPLVGLVTSLRSQPEPEARPEFVASLRERLMLAAETALVPDTPTQVVSRQPAQRRTTRERRIAAAIGGFAIVSASASMSVAAQSALPGDTLYPLKRGLENVHTNVLRGADDKGATMLDNASSRLDEVDELSRTGGQDPQVIAQTLQDFSDQAEAASTLLLSDFEETGRLSSIAELRSFTASSFQALERLETLVPVEVRASLIRARDVLDEIDRQAVSLCPACSDLPALISSQITAAAERGPIYDLIDDTVPTTPATSPGKSKGKGATEGEPPTVTQPDPAPKPTAQAPTAPAEDDDPTGAGNGLQTAVGGLGELDLGDVLAGVTDTVGEVLAPVTGATGKTDK